jgi:hypothetical protein
MLHLLDLICFLYWRCTNPNCMATMASTGATYRLWNRDLVGAFNMLHILWSLRHTGEIPQRFRRASLAQRLTFRFSYRWTIPTCVKTVRAIRGLLYWFNQGSDVNPRFFLRYLHGIVYLRRKFFLKIQNYIISIAHSEVGWPINEGRCTTVWKAFLVDSTGVNKLV